MREKHFLIYMITTSAGKLYALNCTAVVTQTVTLFFGGSLALQSFIRDVPIEKETDIPLNLDMILVNGGNKSNKSGGKTIVVLSEKYSYVLLFGIKVRGGFSAELCPIC